MTFSSVLIMLLLVAAIVLLVIVAVQLAALLRRQAEGEGKAFLAREALTATESRVLNQFEVLRRSAGEVNALQRKELNDTLAGVAKMLTDAISAQTRTAAAGIDTVRSMVSERVPAEVGRTVGARFEADFGKVRAMLDEVRTRLEGVTKLGTGVEELHGSMDRFTRLLGNVKARGTWGEWQLGKILDDMFAPGQVGRNVHPDGSSKVVEFAIALPGQEEGHPVWLPIDSKFPQEDYLRLQQAALDGDSKAEEDAGRALQARVTEFARKVRDLYIIPPFTTDFAVLYLPTEGLYLEVVRHQNTVEKLQREYGVLLAGPTSLVGLINALSVGFRTLAVQRNTSEVIKRLQIVKKALDGFERNHVKLSDAFARAAKVLGDDRTKLNTLTTSLKTISLDSVSDENGGDGSLSFPPDATEDLSHA